MTTTPGLELLTSESSSKNNDKSSTAEEDLKVAVPEEEKSFSFDYLPPLSITDSLQLLGRVIRLLNPVQTDFWEIRKDKALEVIKIVQDYVKMTDETHSSLSHYRWYFIGRQKASAEGIDEDVFEVRPVLKQVGAITFAAEGSNVLIHTVKVINAKDESIIFKVNREIEANLPKKEICFLYFPTDIKSIIIDYSAEGDKDGQVSVYGGVSPLPEFAKSGIYHLSLGQKYIKEDKADLAIDHIKKAWVNILKYKNSRQL